MGAVALRARELLYGKNDYTALAQNAFLLEEIIGDAVIINDYNCL
jgi:hypothetical protein